MNDLNHKSTSSVDAPRPKLLSDLVGDLVREAEAATEAKRNGRKRGPITGLPMLDEVLGSFLAPGVHMLQGAPGAGKTALARQFGADCGFPCLYVTAEMPELDQFQKLIARTTKTDLGKFTNALLSPGQVEALAQRTAEKVPMMAFLDTHARNASRTTIQAAAEALMERFEMSNVLIVIDSVQVWARAAFPGLPEYDRVTAAIDATGAIGRSLTCPVIAIGHRNRAGQLGGNPLHAGKGSGDLEYAAESLLDLESRDDGPVRDVDVEIAKNRHGGTATIPLQFNGRIQNFTEA